jgi:hypothetical protein
VSWPVALRAVRGWLEPWIMALALLERLVATAPTRLALQLLLSWLECGQAIALYSSA